MRTSGRPIRRNLLLYLLYQPYKWLFYFPFLFINTLFFGTVALLVSTLVNERTGSFFGGVLWARLNASLTPIFVKVLGKENIAADTSYIVIPNHQSYFDIFLIYGWLGIDLRWIMKKELARIPGLGFGSKKVGHIFLDRSNNRAARESLDKAKEKLVNGTSVVIFPEGTRSKDGRLGRFKRGAFKLAMDLDRPLLPITINGTRNVLPTGTVDLFPGRVSMTIHPPVNISNLGEEHLNGLMDHVAGLISSELKSEQTSRFFS